SGAQRYCSLLREGWFSVRSQSAEKTEYTPVPELSGPKPFPSPSATPAARSDGLSFRVDTLNPSGRAVQSTTKLSQQCASHLRIRVWIRTPDCQGPRLPYCRSASASKQPSLCSRGKLQQCHHFQFRKR